jgi:hypothetical protein
MVYVISKNGKPLMPTERHGKVRILLKKKKAKVISRKPFTIRLLYDTKEYTQSAKLGIDSGYKYIGYSAVTKDKELISGEVELLSGQTERLKERAMYRNNRRNRLRHRKPRFNNRKRPKDWLAPSIQHKFDSHIRFINKLKEIVPISEVIIEVANFDTHKLKNFSISGKGYQEGEQQGFYNLREYILHRDGYTCQICGAENVPLEVHHIGYWKKDRSNRPANLMAICTKCHLPKNHQEGGKLWGLKPINKGFKETTFMSMVRWRLVNELGCKHTYGYITKSKRIELGLEKSHANDAFAIAGGENQARANMINFNQVRKNNRSLEKFYDAKYIDTRTGKKVTGKELSSGRKCRNKNFNDKNLRQYRGCKLSKGRRSIRKKRYFYQPSDLVKYNSRIYTVKGTQNKGKYVALKEIKKVPKVDLVEPYEFRSGFVAI